MRNMTDAEKIAYKVYPVKWVRDERTPSFKWDDNAGRRECAKEVAEHFLTILKDEQTIDYVLNAFYRRAHGKEPNSKDLVMLRSYMGTALLAYEQQLKRPIGEG